MRDYRRALTIWAEARERAASELSTRAADLSRLGFEADAARLRCVIDTLRIRTLQERAHAGAASVNTKTYAYRTPKPRRLGSEIPIPVRHGLATSEPSETSGTVFMVEAE